MPGLTVRSHWHCPVRNFNTSSQEFYARLEPALQQLQLPGLTLSRVRWREGGAFSAEREYLRIERDRLVFDVCAAPFGATYFFSSWLAEKSSKYGFLLFLAALFLILMLFVFTSIFFRLLLGNGMAELLVVPMAIVSLPVVLFVIGFFIHDGALGSDVEALVIDAPVFGWLYLKIFGPGTYYKVDTVQTFQAAVHAVVQDAVTEVLTAKGVRLPPELEKKPVMRELFAKSQHAGG